MIWYFLYMGLLTLTLVVWGLVALTRPRKEENSPAELPANSLDFRPKR